LDITIAGGWSHWTLLQQEAVTLWAPDNSNLEGLGIELCTSCMNPPPPTVTHKAEQSQHSIQGTNNRKLGRTLSVRLLVAYYAERVE